MLSPDDSLGTTAQRPHRQLVVDRTLRGQHPRSAQDGQVLNLQLGGASQAVLSDRNFVRVYGRPTSSSCR